jgi:hypothetical protein
MVTSIGIILGFQLGFLANWAAEADGAPAVSSAGDAILALTFLASICLFTLVLLRVLDNRKRADAGPRYAATLRLYLAALLTAIGGLVAALFV